MAYNIELLSPYVQTNSANLTTQNIGLFFLFAFIAWYTTTSITSYLPLKHISGPPLLVHSRLYQAIRASQAKLPNDFYQAIQKYGHIVRVGPHHIITDEPDLMRRSWAVRSEYTRSKWYHFLRLHPDRDNVVSMTDEHAHNVMRAKLGPGYSGREVEDLEERVDRNILALIKLIEEKYVKEGRKMDLSKKVQYVTMDVLSDIAFSEKFGFVEKDEDLFRYIETLEDNLPAMMAYAVFPWVVDVMRWKIFRAFLPNEKDLFGLGRVIAVSNKVVAKRFGSEKDPKVRDMLSSFIKNGLTQEEAESETMLQIVAGSDTSAGSIRTVMYHLMTHPHIMERLQQEIETHNLSWPIVRDEETREMPYLQAIICENHRMLPPIGGMYPKTVPPEGDTFNGVYIPPGTEVGVNWIGMMRRKDLWGDNSDEFDPDRFLDGAVPPDVLRERRAVVDLVFGHGRFKCLGKPVAFLEVTKVIVELVRRFDMEFVDPNNPWEFRAYGVNRIRNFWVTVKPRKSG